MRLTGSSHGWSIWSPPLGRKAWEAGVSPKGGLYLEEAAQGRAALQASLQIWFASESLCKPVSWALLTYALTVRTLSSL